MFRKGLAILLSASLILLFPEMGSYRAWAAVRVTANIPGSSSPVGVQTGAATRHYYLPTASLGSLSPGLNSPFSTAILNPTLAPNAAPVAPAAAVQPSGRSVLENFRAQENGIRETLSTVEKMPVHEARTAGAAMMDRILRIPIDPRDGGDVTPLGAGVDFGHANLLAKPFGANEDGGKRPPPLFAQKPAPRGQPLSPATAAGQIVAGSFFAALAGGAVYGSKSFALMSLAGSLAYAPLAAIVMGSALAVSAAGFFLLGVRMVLSRSGRIEAGDTAPMPRPYAFFKTGGLRRVLMLPVEGEKPVYIPDHAVWTLKLHAKVRAKAGRLIAYGVQAAGNVRLLFGEAVALVRAAAALIPLAQAMYQGDDEVRPFVKAHNKSLRALQGMNIIQALSGVAGSYVVGGMVDAAIADTGGLFALLLAGLVGIAAANVLLNTAYEWIKSQVTANVLTDFRVHLFGHILKLPFGFFNREKPSEIAARLAVDVAQLSVKNVGIPAVLPYYGAMALFSGIMMAMTSVHTTLIVAALIPLFALLSTIYGNKAERLHEAQFDRRAEMISASERALDQVRDVRAFSTETVEKKRYLGKADNFLGTIMRMVRVSAAYNGGMGQFYQLTFHVLVLGIGLISFMMTGAPTIGETMALVGYAAFMRQALSGSLLLYTQYRETSGAARRIMTYLKEKSAMQEAAQAADPGRLEGDVEFKGVTFSHDGIHPVLKNLAFKAAPGQSVVLVGGTSSAKSALLNLIGHLDTPDSGEIVFGGKDTRGLKSSSLRRQMSLLHDQGIWVDLMTIRENLTYGMRRDVSDQEIQNALTAAGADFVLNAAMFPEGLDAVLPQGDWRMTEMKKKLLEIARSHIADPRILLLDRPAGGLNHFEAGQILASLEGLKRGRTSFSVAGRTDEAQFADVILVLKDGEIVEQGAHAELLALQGAYYKLIWAEKAKDKAAK